MSAATFAASAALAPASTSAASSLNRISVPRAPLSARFLRPSLSSVSPSRRRSAAATTCSKRSRRAARGIVVSPDGAGALASSLLGLVLGSLLCLSLCPACWRSRAFGRRVVVGAASLGLGGSSGAEPGCALRGGNPRALRALSGSFFMHCGGLSFALHSFSPALGSVMKESKPTKRAWRSIDRRALTELRITFGPPTTVMDAQKKQACMPLVSKCLRVRCIDTASDQKRAHVSARRPCPTERNL